MAERERELREVWEARKRLAGLASRSPPISEAERAWRAREVREMERAYEEKYGRRLGFVLKGGDKNG